MKSATLRGFSAAVTGVALLVVIAPAAQAAPAVSPAASTYLSISMQAQEKSNWCWDASGNTVADWWGHDLTQTKFCQIAHNESGSDCANQQGYLSDQQRVYRWLGFSSAGYYNSNGYTLSFSGIRTEIDNRRPIGTRIGWSSGGGHMHVIYGYNADTTSVLYGDPWPSSNRYNSMSYTSYKSNSRFTWTHTVYGVKG